MSEGDEDDWFNKDIEDFVIPDWKEKSFTAEFDEDYERQMQLEDKVKLLSFNQEDFDGNFAASHSSVSHKDSVGGKEITLALKDLRSYLAILETADILWIILARNKRNGGWKALFSFESMSKEMISLSLRLVGSICDSPFLKTKSYILAEILDNSVFWDQVHRSVQQAIDSAFRNTLSSSVFWQQIFCGEDFTMEMLWNCLFQIWMESRCSGNVAHAKIKELSQSLEKCSYQKKTFEQKTIGKVLTIFPSKSELIKQPTDKASTINHARNTDEYLQRNLFILREDFLVPIRKEIAEFRQNHRHKFNNIKVYPKVRINLANNHESNSSSMFVSHHSFKWSLFAVNLDPDCQTQAARAGRWYSNANWSQSKCFMNGSLLLFTRNMDFGDLVLAVVGHRDSKMLQNGFVNIEIKAIEGNCNQILDTDLIMIESHIFFQPYHHVFNSLLRLNDHNFPLKNYIIENDKTQHYPNYINAQNHPKYAHKYYNFDLKSKAWPSPAQLKLNESQLEAFRAGLTNKFCIIQGPCGTGKTFIGLEIISALLTNTDKQILIVCYTNHALDQFLLGLLKYTKSIVRMGSQSKNEILDIFNIKNLEHPKTSSDHQTYLKELKREQQSLLAKFGDLQNSNCVDFQDIMLIQERLQSLTLQIEEFNQMTTYLQIVGSKKRIVGMTTTCAARYNPMLNALKISIVLIEEAAQILESHVIASLTKHTEHLIMIGDHQQLRPINSEYSFKELYNIDVSLMERLINSGISYVRLNVQHRMRREIANLIRPHIFEDLIDDDSVIGLPSVKGMASNLFFINHTHLENEVDDETTKNNYYEAKFLILLCSYLRHQGYTSEEITILSTYNGQKGQLTRMANDEPLLENVKILTVDNYQGEENKIVLLSLVRSNNQNSIGFLGMSNRICVALSRAKEGLYIIGNMEFLSKNSQLWTKIKNVLEKQAAIGTKLGLECSKHHHLTHIGSHEDFKSVNYGGCSNVCDHVFPCSHLCIKQCHSALTEHATNCKCK